MMKRWLNRVAVVTGASSGIGEATAADLVKNGFRVVALARREDRLKQNQQALPENLRSRFIAKKCDVTNESQVKEVFHWIEVNLGGTDVLINNAGIIRSGADLIKPDNTADIRATIDTNIMAVVYCVREAFDSMWRRNFDGHVVIVNSVAGHKIPIMPGSSLNIYPPSKHAVTAMVETYRQEFASAGTKVRVTSVSPGAVETEIIPNADDFKKLGIPILKSEDVSSAILYTLSTPPHVQIHELIIKPVGENF